MEVLLSDIERWSALGKEAPKGLIDSVCERAPKFSERLVTVLTQKLTDPQLDEERVRVYLLILGETKDTRATASLIGFYKKTKSETAKLYCITALMNLGLLPGGSEAREFVSTALDSMPKPEMPDYSASDLGTLLSGIENLAELGDAAPNELGEAIAAAIPKFGTNVSHYLAPKLNRSGSPEATLRVYIGLLGLTQDTNAVPPLIEFARRTMSPILKDGCFASLATIGGEEAVRFLLPVVVAEKSQERRFNLLNTLAKTRHRSLLPATLEVLKSDPNRDYWRPVLIFGKMGDVAVPFLVDRIADPDRVVRLNAITILGHWMFAPEALQPLRERFRKEADPEIRRSIYSAVKAIATVPTISTFLNEVATASTNQESINAARKGLKEIPKLKAQYMELKSGKRPSAGDFRKEFEKLYESGGTKGDFDILLKSSTLSDEPALKRLRERVLERNSDEAFGDYRRISGQICINRIVEDLK